jgi:hypothetical protein
METYMLSLGRRAAVLAVLVLASVVISNDAQSAAPPGTAQLPTGVLPVRAPVVPQPIVVLALVRNTLLAVDHANKTGNYTVLRDLSGPDFHDSNDAARLAQIFAPLRSQAIDLLAVSVIEPQYKEPPRLTAKRMLYVAGRFPLSPRPVTFELLFEVVRGQWRIYGISIVPV